MAAGSSKKKRQKVSSTDLIASQVAEMKDGITQIESFIKEAAVLAETEVRRVEEIKDSLEAAVARLEAELREKEEMLRKKDSVLKELEEGLTTQIRDLENQVRKEVELLETRDAEMKDLKSKLDAFRVPAERLFTLGEEKAIPLRDLEKELGRGIDLSKESEERGKDFEEGTTADPKIKVIDQSMRDVVVKPGRIAKRQAGQKQKNSRLVSLLGPVKKRS